MLLLRLCRRVQIKLAAALEVHRWRLDREVRSGGSSGDGRGRKLADGIVLVREALLGLLLLIFLLLLLILLFMLLLLLILLFVSGLLLRLSRSLLLRRRLLLLLWRKRLHLVRLLVKLSLLLKRLADVAWSGVLRRRLAAMFRAECTLVRPRRTRGRGCRGHARRRMRR